MSPAALAFFLLLPLSNVAEEPSQDPQQAETERPTPAEAARQASRLLGAALARASQSGAPELSAGEQRALLVDASLAAADTLHGAIEDSRVANWLEQLAFGSASLDTFGRRLRELADDLAFQPVREAPLPLGFPAEALLHEIEIAHYPAYRLASAPIGGLAFWRLFAHIQRERIAMTAPVETTWEGGREARMAFLYERPDQGRSGSDGSVSVEDVPAMTVVRIGLRGNTNRVRVEEARGVLLGWLAEQDEWEVAGPLRVLGYNSPSVRGARRFFEVQLPVRPAERIGEVAGGEPGEPSPEER